MATYTLVSALGGSSMPRPSTYRPDGRLQAAYLEDALSILRRLADAVEPLAGDGGELRAALDAARGILAQHRPPSETVGKLVASWILRVAYERVDELAESGRLASDGHAALPRFRRGDVEALRDRMRAESSSA